MSVGNIRKLLKLTINIRCVNASGDIIKCLFISLCQCCSIWSGTIINVVMALPTSDKCSSDKAIHNAIIVFPVPGGSIKIPPLKLCNGISLS